MDETLKELKRLREETEARFRSLLERAEEEHSRLHSENTAAEEALDRLGETPEMETERELLERLLRLQQRAMEINALLLEGLREMMALDNARSAELARQLTVLPFSRMDLLFDEFERRLEGLESRLQRLE